MLETMILDATFWIYLCTLIATYYCIGLFAWWWQKTGKIRPMFLYVLILLMGLGWDSTMSVYARALLHFSEKLYLQLMHSNFWAARFALKLIGVLLIGGHMSWRAFVKKVIILDPNDQRRWYDETMTLTQKKSK